MEPRALHACVVTLDPLLVTAFRDACGELGIEVHGAACERLPDELAEAKYEAVLIDFDTMPDPVGVFNTVRQSPSNRHAVILAVTTESGHRRQALASGAQGLLERPIDPKEIRRILHGSYESMARERRRYFRCATEIPALAIRSRSGEEFKCTTMNVSSSGVGLRVPVPLEAGEEIHLVLFLREADTILRAVGTVVWDDRHGKTGISIKCTNTQHQAALDVWLDAQFSASRPEDRQITRKSL